MVLFCFNFFCRKYILGKFDENEGNKFPKKRKFSKLARYGEASKFYFGDYLTDSFSGYTDQTILDILKECREQLTEFDPEKINLAVKDWLKKGETSDLIDIIFNNSNGHVLEQHISLELNDYLSKLDTERLDHPLTVMDLIENIICNGNLDKVKSEAPIQQYYQFKQDIKQKAED